MIHQVPVKAYKIHPMQPEIRMKVENSYAESISLKERELHYPHCNHYIASLYSGVSGYFKAKCSNCKAVTVYNLGYFRRKHLATAGKDSGRRKRR